MHKEQKIFVAGHNGLVGSALLRKLRAHGFERIVTRRRSELDLTNQANVNDFFQKEKPEIVFLAAARVGGILANSNFPADFIRENLLVQSNVIDAAYQNKIQKLLFLGSSCVYPKFAPQPLREDFLLSSALEPTNEAYAIAKIAGIKMCQAYHSQFGLNCICVMPTNLYGAHDNFDLTSSHVLPAFIRKFHEAKKTGCEKVEIWGTGTPKREFLHVDDLADACLFLMRQTNETIDKAAPDRMFNIGTGADISISDLARLVSKVIGVECELEFDQTKPDGSPRKLLDVTRLDKLGWKARISLEEGIHQTYQWYKQFSDK